MILPLWRPLFVALCLLSLGLAAARAGAAPSVLPLGGLEAELQAIVEAQRLPGVAVAVVTRDGAPWVRGFGHVQGDPGRSVRGDTLFRVASVSKSFLAMAVMRLVERGALRLDARVLDAAPELGLVNPWEATHPLLLVHLLEHTAGLSDYHFTELLTAENPDGPPAPAAARVAADPRWLRLRWPPGERFAYSNRGYAVAAYLLEQAAGAPWSEVVRREVLDPLGIAGAGYQRTPDRAARLVEGYVEIGAPPAPYLPVWFEAGAGLLASIEDLAALTQACLRGGAPLVSATTLARMQRPGSSLAAEAGLGTGSGLGLVARVKTDALSFGHYGGGYAYRSLFRYFPREGVGYALSVNTIDHRRSFVTLQDKIVARLGLPAIESRPQPRTIPAAWQAFTGGYIPGNPRLDLTAGPERLLGTSWVRVGARGLEAWDWDWRLPGPRRTRLESWGEAWSQGGKVPVFGVSGEAGPSSLFVDRGAGVVWAGEERFDERWPAPLPWPLVLEVFVGVAFLVALTGVWVVPLLVLVRPTARARYARAWGPAVSASGCLLLGLAAAGTLPVASMGRFGLRAAVLYLCSGAYPWLVLGALWRGWKSSHWRRVLLGAHAVAAAALISWGWVGVRVWAD